MSDSLLSRAKEDRRIVALTPAMPVGSKLTRFQNELPGQFFDVGIAEQHAVTMSGGLASNGMKPYLAIYSTFLQRGFDQLLHDVDRQNLNVFIGIDRSGLVGADGETHQGVFDISFITPLPNMTLMMPRDEVEAASMIDLALEHDGPIALRYPRGNVKGLDFNERREPVNVGKWEEISSGEDIALISFGPTLDLAIDAAAALKESGISARVINARFLKPVDEEMLLSLGASNIPVLSVEEAILNGGLGSMIATFMADHGFHNPIKRIGIDNEYIEHGDVNKLLKDIGISTENIILQSKILLEQTHEKEIKN